MPHINIDDVPMLENLACTRLGGEMIDVESISVLACTHFYNTRIYDRFVNNVASMAITNAIAAATGAQNIAETVAKHSGYHNKT